MANSLQHGFAVGDYVLKVNNKDSDVKNGRKFSRAQVLSRPTTYRSTPNSSAYAEHRAAQTSRPTDATPQFPDPAHYHFPTPAYSGGYMYAPGPQYAAPFQYGWNGAPAFAGPYAPSPYGASPYQPSMYGTPTPNPFYGHQGYPVDYNMAPYQQADYYSAYAAQPTPVETVPEEQSATPEESAEEQTTEEQ